MAWWQQCVIHIRMLKDCVSWTIGPLSYLYMMIFSTNQLAIWCMTKSVLSRLRKSCYRCSYILKISNMTSAYLSLQHFTSKFELAWFVPLLGLGIFFWHNYVSSRSFWSRYRATSTPTQEKRFIDTVSDYAAAVHRQVGNRERKKHSSISEYIALRRQTSAMKVCAESLS